jgi:uncharacterized protein (TIGR03435 family)
MAVWARARTSSCRPSRPCRPRPCAARAGIGRLSGNTLALSQLASFLAASVDRAIVDRTGLTGNFNFDLTWAPDQPSAGPLDAPAEARNVSMLQVRP